jgi:hypothetical protein
MKRNLSIFLFKTGYINYMIFRPYDERGGCWGIFPRKISSCVIPFSRKILPGFNLLMDRMKYAPANQLFSRVQKVFY